MKRILCIFSFVGLLFFSSCEENKEVALQSVLYGTVVDAQSGDPIPTAIVTIKSMIEYYYKTPYNYYEADYAWGHTYAAVTGSDGRYEIPNIDKSDLSKYESGYNEPVEKYFITIEAEGYQEHQSHDTGYQGNNGPDQLEYCGYEYYTIVIEPGWNVQYDAALKKK